MEAIQGYNYHPPYNPYQQYPQQYQYPPQYQQQNKPQPTASAVTINIIEPKAYAGAEAPKYPPPPPPVYSYPQASIYGQPGMPYPMPPVLPPMPMPMPLPPATNQSQIVNQAPQVPPPPQPVPPPPVQQQPIPPQVQQPMPQPVPPQVQQPMPQPVPPVQQQPVPQQQQPQPVQQPQQQQPVQQPQQPQQPQVPELSVNDLPAINAALQQGDPNVKAAAIEAIARIGQGDANTYTGLINEVMTDTSKMSGDQKAFAEENRKHAIWTLAILNKNQNPQVGLVDLPGASQFLNVLRDDPNPEMRKAVISALDFLAKPEDAQMLNKIYSISAKKDKNPEVSALAKQALANLQQVQQGQAA